jgi:hypothetical protein
VPDDVAGDPSHRRSECGFLMHFRECYGNAGKIAMEMFRGLS